MAKATIFTCIDGEGKKQTYEGFRKPYVKTLAHPQVLAVVALDGCVELWALDHETPDAWQHACEELERYYRSEHGVEAVRIAVFDRRLILESE